MSDEPEHIAVIRFSSLGDIVTTGPAVRALKARFPDSNLVYVTTTPYNDLAAALPGVDEVVALRRRGEGFREDAARLVEMGPRSRVADLQGSSRSAKLVKLLDAHQVVTEKPPRLRRTLLLATRIRFGDFLAVPDRMVGRLAEWGVQGDDGSLQLDIPDEVTSEVERRWGDRVRGAVVLVTGAKHETKRWPDTYWRELLDLLPPDKPVVVLGGKGEFPASFAGLAGERVLDLTGATGILQAAALLKLASLVISGDTGPMHLAVAAGTPLVAMYGPTVREFGFYPYKHDRSVVLERKLVCRPCSAHGSARCPLGHHKCMREITPRMVSDAAADLNLW
ncbi:glycosyltransferase family 9 protein [bacterium]|nr:glycosyltransferase family 9 protein [bacterium]